MKMTFKLPDEIFQRPKLLATEQRKTLKDLMPEALCCFLDASGEIATKTRKANLKRTGRRPTPSP